MASGGSNSGRYTLCPYYRWEYEARITCEDTYRHFGCRAEKNAWMDMYCDSWDWMKCPYAADMAEAYKRFEEGDKMAIEKHENEALKKELKSIAMRLGRANKKVDKLTAKNKDLETQKKLYFEKWKAADAQLKAYEEKVAGQIGKIVEVYEQRMAFLIDTCTEDGCFYEKEAEAWAGDRPFAIVHDEDEGGRFWKVVFQEEENENDGKHNDKAVSGDDRNEAQV